MLKNVNGFSMGDVYETTAKGEQGRLIAASWLITMGKTSTSPYIIFFINSPGQFLFST